MINQLEVDCRRKGRGEGRLPHVYCLLIQFVYWKERWERVKMRVDKEIKEWIIIIIIIPKKKKKEKTYRKLRWGWSRDVPSVYSLRELVGQVPRDGPMAFRFPFTFSKSHHGHRDDTSDWKIPKAIQKARYSTSQ